MDCGLRTRCLLPQKVKKGVRTRENKFIRDLFESKIQYDKNMRAIERQPRTPSARTPEEDPDPIRATDLTGEGATTLRNNKIVVLTLKS